MFYSNTLNLIQVGGGTQVKQGDLGSRFSYKLANEKEQELDVFDKEVAHINLVLDDKIVFTTTATVDNSTVTFNIDKAIPVGLYFLEIKIRDYIFPSDKQTIIFVQSGAVAYDLKDLVPNYDTNMTLKSILSDLSQKGIDITDLNRQLAKKANKDEVTNVMTPKGAVLHANLPTTGNTVGDYYYCSDGDGVHPAGNYVWNGTTWYFGGTGDEGYNLLKKDISDKLHEFTEISHSANYFDKTKIKSGYFLNYKGAEVAHNQCFYSEKIPVKAGDIIRFTYSSTTASQSGILYKKDNSFILFNNMSDGFSAKKGGSGDFTYSELVVPENGEFICINGALGNIDNVMVTVNVDFPQYFVSCEVFKKIADDVSVENNVLKLSPLYGKNIYSHGDSIMYGAGDGGKGMLQYIVDDYAMAYTKYAVSGATIAYSDSYNSPKVISRDIVNMSDTIPDYVIIEGGYNDSCHPSAIPLGSITDGYDSELDDTTFCGALESYLKQIKTKYPSAKIGFVISHKAGFYGGNRWNTKSNGYIPYVRAVCEKWSVPYLDMYKDGGFVPSPSNLTVSYTNNSDYVHPTEDGYKLFYYHKLLKFMESL